MVAAGRAHVENEKLKWALGTRDFVPGPNSKIIMLEKSGWSPPP